MHTSPESAYGRSDGLDPPGATPNQMPRLRGQRLLAALSALAIAATTASIVPPASASLTGAGVRAGSNITVFHNTDFVAVFGYGHGGENILVEVFRNDVLIGHESGPPVDHEGTPGIEVNHGPEGPVQDGDCWEGHTPDIRPGDVIRVTDAGGTDEVTVDDITFSGPASLDPVTNDVLVKGVAKTFDGTNIPVSALDSGEFRDVLPSGQFRTVPDETRVDPLVDGGFIMVYHPPYVGKTKHPTGSTEAQRRNSLLNSGGHATGFGHVDPLPPESMLVDGIEDVPGPALGCEDSQAARDAVTSLSDSVLNQTDVTGADLVVSGMSFDASDVKVAVGSSDAVTATITGAAGGPQTWTASVPMEGIAAQDDGELTVSMIATRTAGGSITGRSKSVVKDTTGPTTAPSAAPAPRAEQYVDTQNVTLTAGPGETIRYTTGPTSPTATTGTVYSGPIAIGPGTTTLNAVAVDAAGNAGPMLSGSYTVVKSTTAAAPRAVRATGDNARARVSWSAPSFTGHVPITGYKLRVFRGSSLADTIRLGTVNRTTVRNLVNGATYRFSVTAVNRNGDGAQSARSNVVRPRTVPSSPRGVRALVNAPGGPVTGTVVWSAPRSTGGARITRYVVRAAKVRVNGFLARRQVVAIRPARARAATVNLRPGIYRYQVRAVNAVGDGPYSAFSNARRAR